MLHAQSLLEARSALHLVQEVNQPLAALLTNAEAALQWLAREPADLGEAMRAIERIVADSRRVADALESVRDAIGQSPAAAPAIDMSGEAEIGPLDRTSARARSA
jgi:C4-dicarboxylate-specific signal transduction histidine kinase